MIAFFRNRSDFLKNAFKLVAGTAVAQAITFLLTPFITRLYSPSDMGAFTFFISIVGGFGLIGTLRYEMAIVLQKEDKESVNISFLSILIALVISLLPLITVFFPAFLIRLDPLLHRWIFLMPPMIFMVSLGNIFQHWYNRKKEYRTLAAAKILNSTGNNLVALLLGILGVGAWGLLVGNLAGLLFFNFLFVAGIFLRYRHEAVQIDFPLQKKLAHKHKDLPLANTPQMLVELVQLYGIIYLLKAFYSADIIGLYSLSQRLLQAPMWLIGTSLGQVFYKEASERYHADGDIKEMVLKTIRLAAIVALPVLIILLLAGPWLIGLVFGKAWTEAGQFARILAPMMFFDFIRYSISQTPLIIGKTRQMFFITMIGAGLIIISICLGGFIFRDATIGFIIFSAMLSIYSIGVILWIVSSVKKERQE